jgi:hypothetical protein
MNRLLNSVEKPVRVVRRFSAASKLFIFVSPRGICFLGFSAMEYEARETSAVGAEHAAKRRAG